MTFCVTFWHKIAYFYAFGPKRSIYHTFTYRNIQNSELSSVNRGVATLNAISGHDFHLPLEGNSKFIHPPKIIFASFIISTPLLNQSLNQNDSNFEFRQIQFLSCQQKSTLDFEKPLRVYRWPHFYIFVRTPKSMWMWSESYVDFWNTSCDVCRSFKTGFQVGV